MKQILTVILTLVLVQPASAVQLERIVYKKELNQILGGGGQRAYRVTCDRGDQFAVTINRLPKGCRQYGVWKVTDRNGTKTYGEKPVATYASDASCRFQPGARIVPDISIKKAGQLACGEKSRPSGGASAKSDPAAPSKKP